MLSYSQALSAYGPAHVWIIGKEGRPVRCSSKDLLTAPLYWFAEGANQWVKFKPGEYVLPKSNRKPRRRKKRLQTGQGFGMDLPSANLSPYAEDRDGQ
jgi:hypothetical protein